MFQGRLVEDLPDHVRIQSDELGGTVYVDHGISSAPGATVWAAIRPEKINLLRTPPADAAENCVKGVVKEIAYMGDMSIYLVKIESGKTVRVTQPNVERLSDDERILWDETVWLSWHASSPVVVTQ
jgi:putrescine transport system ATP-binding protein